MTSLHVDCRTCRAKGPACADCVVSVLLGPPSIELVEPEVRALEVLSDAGLLPPLRLEVPAERTG
ncbi:hypothetical protein SAMN02745244_00269 [Tessaracoccus bendigoensis DSM 12906]|uniref:Uncharacterized protein n=1 Tax=Tessaracoccus bendigoensis DSM 12906 TaxID=1123357 RepID=A0A1M6ATN0_9ACTN|nr:hypothetical protein [Tessaracoccus bendigoensis]SHI39668.1 hypothetical protein SAMN02745244_00269 [Tessaracoccus bendigoensis DSM 12906]